MTNSKKTTVRRHPPAAVIQLVHWCAQHAGSEPEKVAAVGLSYGYGLNEHQQAAATLRTGGEAAIVEFPLARRRDEIRNAPRRPLTLESPSWLVTSLRLLAEPDGETALLFRPHRRIGTVGPGKVRQLVSDAAAEATGLVMSPATLISTRNADLAEQGLIFALFDRGWAPSYIARLADPKVELIMPRRRAV